MSAPLVPKAKSVQVIGLTRTFKLSTDQNIERVNGVIVKQICDIYQVLPNGDIFRGKLEKRNIEDIV